MCVPAKKTSEYSHHVVWIAFFLFSDKLREAAKNEKETFWKKEEKNLHVGTCFRLEFLSAKNINFLALREWRRNMRTNMKKLFNEQEEIKEI